MQKILIPLFIAFVGSMSLFAQTPEPVWADGKPGLVSPASAEMMCNNAGTFQFGAHIGQSNDVSPDTIFLCHRDSLFINHNNNSVLSGDPQLSTPAGIVWGFYTCPPTVMGDNLAAVVADPCIVPNATSGFFNIARGDISGDIWFSNSGSLLVTPNQNGVQYWFAPLTIDNFTGAVYENTGGGPAGPCVNVNTNDAFSVVYLKEITLSGLSNSIDGDQCLGRVKVEGGWPAFDANRRYTLDIYKTSNPSVKAILLDNVNNITNGKIVRFLVNEPGNYTISVEDGKSCGAMTTVDMTACDTTGSVNIIASEELGINGTQVCVPITTVNFNSNNILSMEFSVNWDPTVLSYVGTTSTLPGFNPGSDLNQNEVSQGNLGFGYLSPSLGVINLNDGDTIMNICFNVIGTSGAFTPITFSGTPAQNTFNNDQGNAIAPFFNTGSVTVVNPGVTSFTTNIINATCNGTAQIVIRALGGQPPYSFSWQSGGGPVGMGNIANLGGTLTTPVLTSGTYSITMTDANGMTITGTAVIPAAQLGATLTFVQLPLCRGQANGIIRADIILNGSIVSNPGPQYTYSWSPATVPSPGSRTQNGVAQGFYSVTITDTQSGCTAAASGTLSEPAALSRDNVNPINASCPGISDGALTLLMQGGTPSSTGNYEFDWTYSPTGNPPFNNYLSNQISNPSQLNALAAGVYRVTVTDSNGCTFTDQVTINNARTLSLALASSANVACYGGSTGALSVNAIITPNVPAAFTFQWTPNLPGATVNNTSASSVITGIPAGAYILRANENGTGCFTIDTFSITQADSIRVLTNIVNPSCTAPTSGSIGTTVTGGTNPYSYAWAPAPPAPTGNQGTASNLPAGTYMLTVSDNLGCTKVVTNTLLLPNPPSVTLDSTSVSCGGDGCVRATGVPIAGTTITGYQWANQTTGTVIGTTAQVCNLNGGSYIVTVTASDLCTVVDTLTLFSPDILALDTVTYILPACFGDSNGIVGVTMMGGNTPYQYTWSVPGASGPALVGVPAGSYTVTVSDDDGCTTVVNTLLSNPIRLVMVFPPAQITQASCFGLCDGSAVPLVSYNTVPPTSANYNFAWSSGELDSIPNSLCAGINYVTVTDPNNCFLIDSVIIGQPFEIALDTTITEPTCAGDQNGQVLLTASGGNGGAYIYDWGFTTNNPAQPLAAGTYTVTVVDANGCSKTFDVLLTEPDSVFVNLDSLATTNVICTDDQNGVAAVTVTGGNTGGYIYTWSGNVGNTAIVTDLLSGTYQVTVSDLFGCSGVSGPITLLNPPPVSGSYLPWDELICAGDQTTLNVDTIFGGAGGPYQFTVDYGVELPSSFPVSIGGGQHVITYLDKFGCSTDDTIFVTPGVNMQVVFPQTEIEIQLGDTLYKLNPLITGGIVDQFTWDPIDKVSDPLSLTPFANTFESTTYTLTVVDPNGCEGEGSIYVKVDPNRNVFIPNVIAPLARTGLNQRWKIFTGVGVDKVISARVYDRWGELMYEQEDFKPNNDDYSEGWDGSFRGRLVGTGVYVYLVEVSFLDGRKLIYRGDVTVVK